MGNLREFSLQESNWTVFKAQQFFIANGIEEPTVKKALLLNTCEEEPCWLYRNRSPTMYWSYAF